MLSPHCGCVVALCHVENIIWFVFKKLGHKPQLQHVTVHKSPSYTYAVLYRQELKLLLMRVHPSLPQKSLLFTMVGV
jgi:hypothetical protein